jgi:hypothetical protein
MLPLTIQIADVKMIKFVLCVIGNAIVHWNIRKECNEEAIRKAFLNIINLIWNPLNIDKLLIGSRWDFLAQSCIQIKSRHTTQNLHEI